MCEHKWNDIAKNITFLHCLYDMYELNVYGADRVCSTEGKVACLKFKLCPLQLINNSRPNINFGTRSNLRLISILFYYQRLLNFRLSMIIIYVDDRDVCEHVAYVGCLCVGHVYKLNGN